MTVSVSIGNPDALTEVADRWNRQHIVERMWQRDATVWTDPVRPEIENRLGWLDLPKTSLPLVETAAQLANEAVRENITILEMHPMSTLALSEIKEYAVFDIGSWW